MQVMQHDEAWSARLNHWRKAAEEFAVDILLQVALLVVILIPLSVMTAVSDR